MSNQTICTTEELRTFAWSFLNTNPKYFDFVQWLKSKTDNKYTIVDVEFLLDALKALDNIVLENNKSLLLTTNINEEFKKKWSYIIKML